MYFITGRIYENGKLVAYGLYDVNQKKAIIGSTHSTRGLVLAGKEVVGFGLCTDNFGKQFVRKSKRYMWDRLPELNGKGEPEKEECKDVKILIGTNGFKELRQFITVNSLGDLNVYNAESFKEEVKANRIIGAIITEKNRLLTRVGNEIADQWLMECGFTRNDDLMWERKEDLVDVK